VSKTTKAINYRHRGGSTTIDFKGTTLMPRSRGEAKVESKQGYIEIEVEFDDLGPATQFGPEYLTYVMWAITPGGRPTPLGEVLLNGTKSKLNVTTELQSFGLIITAEPHFAVTRPSNIVIMENALRPETIGKIEEVEAKYELLERGQYTAEVDKSRVVPIVLDRKVPLELYEAQNAVRIAEWGFADRYAADTYQKAVALLKQAEAQQANKAGKKSVVMVAREAAQTAEDARILAMKRRSEAPRLRRSLRAEPRLMPNVWLRSRPSGKPCWQQIWPSAGRPKPMPPRHPLKRNSWRLSAKQRRHVSLQPMRIKLVSRQKMNAPSCAPICCNS
jgi:hypothetical protein